MNRLLHADYAEEIAIAQLQMPDGILDRLRHVEFVCGVSPTFVGLYSEPAGDLPAWYLPGYTYEDVAHTCYPEHTTDRTTTIVLPKATDWTVVIHEYGHALHQTMGFAEIAPVCKYAELDEYECFAEGFLHWVIGEELGPGYWGESWARLQRHPEVSAYFDALAEVSV